MRFPFVLRSRHEAELAAVRSYNNALRERCERAEKNEATERFARRAITRQHAELDAANRRLAGRNLELGQRISKLTEADPEYAAQLEQQLAAAQEALAAETERADRLSSHLDDGDLKAIKEWEKRVEKHDAWKPPTGPDALEKRPVDGASGRPLHPAVELRRAQELCRQLQARLDGHGKQVAS